MSIERTFECLYKWYERIFEKAGWMIVKDNRKKIKYYIEGMIDFIESIDVKLSTINDNDKRADLMIMRNNIKKLLMHFNKYLLSNNVLTNNILPNNVLTNNNDNKYY